GVDEVDPKVPAAERLEPRQDEDPPRRPPRLAPSADLHAPGPPPRHQRPSACACRGHPEQPTTRQPITTAIDRARHGASPREDADLTRDRSPLDLKFYNCQRHRSMAS